MAVSMFFRLITISMAGGNIAIENKIPKPALGSTFAKVGTFNNALGLFHWDDQQCSDGTVGSISAELLAMLWEYFTGTIGSV